MKAITPEELYDDEEIENLVDYFNRCLKKEKKNQSWYSVEINEEHDEKVLDKVSEIYRKAGWGRVSCYISRDIMGDAKTVLALNR